MPNGEDTLKFRVGSLEKQIEKLDGKVDDIMTNHLPHVQEEMMGLKTRVNIFGTLIMGALSTVIALLIGRGL